MERSNTDIHVSWYVYPRILWTAKLSPNIRRWTDRKREGRAMTQVLCGHVYFSSNLATLAQVNRCLTSSSVPPKCIVNLNVMLK